ncbi:hypothetical protein PSACC_03561 [Paramicrosporidium saccamoebae]|uniref:Inositol polyphosphate-related phosphatase domain-containing protein n=1 Tax=Paramicrosporidium saccamoebae TaxID=1246581 RepID=A0A2H9TFQ0_9FUNG|nr:hypothetical protein PSACC_03561 [Paramicrosporidium saccamoebae]
MVGPPVPIKPEVRRALDVGVGVRQKPSRSQTMDMDVRQTPNGNQTMDAGQTLNGNQLTDTSRTFHARQAPPVPARPRAVSADSVLAGISTLQISTLDCHRTRREGPTLESRLQISRSRNVIKRVVVSGELVVAISTATILGWNLRCGELLWSHSTGLDFPESAAFIALDRMAVGTKNGNILVVDCRVGEITKSMSVSGRAIIHLKTTKEELWAVDDAGWVHVWRIIDSDISADAKIGVTRVMDCPTLVHVTDGGIVWVGSGKVLEVHSREQNTLTLAARFDYEADLGLKVGIVTGITSVGKTIVTAHEDGLLVRWNATGVPTGIFQTGSHKITCIEGKGTSLWLGLSNGKMKIICAKDWKLLAEWKAHQTSVIHIDAAQFATNPLHVPLASLCDSACVSLWDANLIKLQVDEILHKRTEEFAKSQNCAVRVCSWNVDSQRPPEAPSFWADWLDTTRKYDLYVVGIQEMVDLESKSTNAKMILASNSKVTNAPSDDGRAQLWVDRILLELKQTCPNVRLVSQKNMVGLMMAVFADPALCIGMVSHEMVKTGLGGLHGNKGAIVTRLTIDDTSLCFVNCHLAAGHSQVAARNTDLSTILKNAHLPRVAQSECVFMGGEGDLIFDHEHVVLFGDLNYRLNTTREAAESAIHAKTHVELLPNDQLLSQLIKVPNHPLSTFKEEPLNFPPTYKYDRGTDVLDTSEKQRIPAYCDRILLRTNSPDARVQNYTSHPLMQVSDHRPISATLTLLTKQIDHLKRETLRLAIQQDWLLKL